MEGVHESLKSKCGMLEIQLNTLQQCLKNKDLILQNLKQEKSDSKQSVIDQD